MGRGGRVMFTLLRAPPWIERGRGQAAADPRELTAGHRDRATDGRRASNGEESWFAQRDAKWRGSVEAAVSDARIKQQANRATDLKKG